MRNVVILLVALVAGGLVAGTLTRDAIAGPAPAVGAVKFTSGLVERADYWRRYYRRYGAPAEIVVPAPVPDATAPAVEAAPVLVPVRPLSCGEYHYWDGQTCVDARFNKPYLGPR
jgi:hypothetical protein